MRTILPLDASDVHEPKVDLVDKCRGLEQMVGVLPSHLAFRQSPQLVVDDRQQFLNRALVAASPIKQQRCDVVSWGHGTSIVPRPFYAASRRF